MNSYRITAILNKRKKALTLIRSLTEVRVDSRYTAYLVSSKHDEMVNILINSNQLTEFVYSKKTSNFACLGSYFLKSTKITTNRAALRTKYVLPRYRHSFDFHVEELLNNITAAQAESLKCMLPSFYGVIVEHNILRVPIAFHFMFENLEGYKPISQLVAHGPSQLDVGNYIDLTLEALQRLNGQGMHHLDLHIGNIMYCSERKDIKVIDIENAVVVHGDHPLLMAFQLGFAFHYGLSRVCAEDYYDKRVKEKFERLFNTEGERFHKLYYYCKHNHYSRTGRRLLAY